MFEFTRLAIVAGSGIAKSQRDFYMSALSVSQVPLPAGIQLLGTAIGGLGLMGRRRKAA